jgi:hypothetical protein
MVRPPLQPSAAAFSSAKVNAEKAGAEAADLGQARFARLDHCIRSRIDGGPGCDLASNKVIDPHRDELKRAVGAS